MSDDTPVNLPPLELPPHLTSGAWDALEHWHKHRPRMYAELHASGKLHEMAIAADEMTASDEMDMHEALMRQGYASPIAFETARQTVRERYIYLPSEEDVPELKMNDEGLFVVEPPEPDDEELSDNDL